MARRRRLRDLLRRVSALDPGSVLTPYWLVGCNHVGERTRALGRPELLNLGHLSLGNDVLLDSREAPIHLRTARTAELLIGHGTSIEFGAVISAEVSVRIGERVKLGPFVSIRDHGDDGRAGAAVEIGDGVRVGIRAQIEPGARIGEGATILPGAIVRGDVPAGATYDGAERARGGDQAREANRTHEAETAPSVTDTAPALRGGASVTDTAPALRGGAVFAARVQHAAVVIADFTADSLRAPLGQPDFDGLCVDAEIAPFGQVVQSLHALTQRPEAPTVAVVWTLADHVSNAFRRRSLGERVPLETILAEVDAFAALLTAHAHAARFMIVPTFVLPPHQRGLGMLELSPEGLGAAVMHMNLRLAQALADAPNVFVLDAQRWVAAAGPGAMNPKLWHMGKVPFSAEVFAEAARDIKAALRGAIGLSRKLIVLDLDETLWGGVVGDVGWENLVLGGHHAEGEAFVEFQRKLLALTRRGITLAVVSKNEESVALEALRRHPEGVLRPEALAAYRINWRDKAQNIAEIAEELNLGLASFVFIDDNPVERSRVGEALPEVYVPDWPADPTQYVRALEALRCFDTPDISAEDVERTRMYGVERERGALKAQVASFEDWLKALELEVAFERLQPSNLSRTAQLMNKTNQMNLRTRRLSERELLEWSQGLGREVWAVHVSDRLGDAGLTGILSLERKGAEVAIEDYVLSCRVMGRRVEEALVWAAVERARALGGGRLLARPIPTAKNKPCLDFWAKTPFANESDALVWRLSDALQKPEHVRIEGLTDSPSLQTAARMES
jgi:FkbH-like protein